MNPFSALYNLVVQAFQVVLDTLFAFTGNYALAIMLLTVLFNLAFLPMRIKQSRGMKIQKMLQPKVDEINARYSGDQEKAAKVTMELWQKYNYNPLSGCGPMLLQLPLFWAILEVFRNISFPEGAASAFLWIANIAEVEPDFMGLPIKILPLLAGLASFLQARLMAAGSPTTNDQAAQSTAMMNMMLPIMMIWICWSQPASLAIYWTTNQVIYALQQLLILKFLKVEIMPEDVVIVKEAKK